MGKDKEAKKEKKAKKIKPADLANALADPGNTSTDIILTPSADKSYDAIEVDEEDLYESRLAAQAPFAKPLAGLKLNKKVLKTIKKGTYRLISQNLMVASQAKELRRGVKEVVKALRKGEKGLTSTMGTELTA
jgi:hypothetical protein